MRPTPPGPARSIAAARRAFGARGIPSYFVSDASGRIRFEHVPEEEVLRTLRVVQDWETALAQN